MKKIKDFFYDHNDILVVLLIVLVAAAVIYWRVNVIMEYPKLAAEEIARNNGTTTSENANTDGTTDGGTSTDGGTTEGGTTDGGTNTDGNTNTDSTQGGSSEYVSDGGTNLNDGLIWEKGVLKNNLAITVPSGSATEAVQALVDAGLFSSYDEFEDIAVKEGVNYGVLAGTYVFPAGSTQEDIVKMVMGAA